MHVAWRIWSPSPCLPACLRSCRACVVGGKCPCAVSRRLPDGYGDDINYGSGWWKRWTLTQTCSFLAPMYACTTVSFFLFHVHGVCMYPTRIDMPTLCSSGKWSDRLCLVQRPSVRPSPLVFFFSSLVHGRWPRGCFRSPEACLRTRSPTSGSARTSCSS